MAMTFTPTVGSAYDFLEDKADMLNGVVPTDFAASYTDVELAMFKGTIVLENANKGVQFGLSYTFTDGVATTAIVKLSALLALRGTQGTLVKDAVTLTGVVLKTATIQSRQAVSGLPFTPISSLPENIVVTIGFHKVDA
jgi:hypothetical protein